MSAYQALSVARGNDVTFKLALTDNGVPLNLTGLSLTFYIKPSSTALDSGATTFTIGSGITVTDAANGKVSVVIPHTANATAGTFWWRIDITAPSIATLMQGNYYVGDV